MPHAMIGGQRTARRLAPGLALAVLVLTAGADGGPQGPQILDVLQHRAERLAAEAASWYRRTPPTDRMTWAGLAACALLGLGVAAERTLRLGRGRVLPEGFLERFQERLRAGKLDAGKATDLCEMNPCPAARVALAAIRRWGYPAADLERAVALARQTEVDRLRRHVGTLRRLAALAPLLGLLGTLLATGRALTALGTSAPATAWAPAVAGALGPLTAGVALAILALVAYDGLAGRVESLTQALDRLGAETVDAIAMTAVPDSRPGGPRVGPAGPARTPHQMRAEAPGASPRPIGREDDPC
ncbi:MAG TPA: MotA/TolQ/ExbB proton channel family protein [Isosphaeraceae bacterium]